MLTLNAAAVTHAAYTTHLISVYGDQYAITR